MPQRRTAIKDLRQSHRRRSHNMDIKTDLKKTIKAYEKSVSEKNIDDAKTNLKTVYKKLDKAAKRQIISDNTAARRKSRLSKLLVSKA